LVYSPDDLPKAMALAFRIAILDVKQMSGRLLSKVLGDDEDIVASVAKAIRYGDLSLTSILFQGLSGISLNQNDPNTYLSGQIHQLGHQLSNSDSAQRCSLH